MFQVPGTGLVTDTLSGSFKLPLTKSAEPGGTFGLPTKRSRSLVGYLAQSSTHSILMSACFTFAGMVKGKTIKSPLSILLWAVTLGSGSFIEDMFTSAEIVPALNQSPLSVTRIIPVSGLFNTIFVSLLRNPEKR